MKPEYIQADIHNAIDAVHAHLEHWLGVLRTVRKVPSLDDLHGVLDELRVEAANSFRTDDAGAMLAGERVAAQGYIALLDYLLREGIEQAVREAGK